MYSFLFDPTQNLTQNDWILFGIFAALIVLGIVELISRKSTRNPIKKTFHSRLISLFFTIGILGAFWAGMRYLFVPYLGTRFAAILILAVGAAWCVFIIRYVLTRYRFALKEWEEKAMREKYLKQN